MNLIRLLLFSVTALAAAAEDYVKDDYMIPMRDGIKLHTEVWRPAGMEPAERLPFLIQRSPYGWGRAKSLFESQMTSCI